MRPPAIALWAGLLLAPACAPDAPPPAPPAKKDVDLDALAARRAATSGAAIEQEAAAARSATAKAVHANAEGEPSLTELEARGQAPEAPTAAIGARGAFDAPREAGGPTDLDRATDGTEPWINMDLVASAIRRRQKALQGCWDTVAMDAPSLGRRVIFDLHVDTHGAGTARLAAGSPTRHPELSRCLSATLARVDYPEAKNGAVSFEYPLTF